nr:GAF and ANTAR domain-containing protein [uncultured Actinoplanes sp.]
MDPGGNNGRGRPSTHDAGKAAENSLADTLGELARTLQNEDSVDATLQAIVEAAVGTVPGADYASLSVVERRRVVHTRAATHDVATLVDKAQYETGEGPCLDSVYDHRTVRLPDMTLEERWPRFTGRAAQLGVYSMLSFQLFVQAENLGALNLFAAQKDAFDDDSEHIGLLFASHAAVAMVGAQRQEDMDKAVAARDVIGQAKGILMERYKITADQAFATLARASQETNLKLVELARQLTVTGELRGDR